MAKLNWDKADEYDVDPGTLIEVPEVKRPLKCDTPRDREKRAAERSRKAREARERSEQHDSKLTVESALREIRRREACGEPLADWQKVLMKLYGP